MIKNEQKFRKWISENKKGSNLEIENSINSKISILNVVSILIGEDISEENLFDEICVELISHKLRPYRNGKSISGYKLVLKQYAKMIENLKQNTLANTS